MPLTDKQEAFCREYILNLGNASAAYRHAYDTENMAENTIWTEAWKLKTNPEVANRLEELREETLEGYKVDKEYITRKLLKIVDKTDSEVETQRKTLMDLGKLHGLITDKKEIRIDDSDLLKRIKDAK